MEKYLFIYGSDLTNALWVSLKVVGFTDGAAPNS